MSIPKTIYIYRIIHIENLEYILSKKKLTCPVHSSANPNYIGIGDNSLKRSRRDKLIEIEPNGTFSDYVAFYFGYRTPMLYNIKNGFLDVPQRPQEDIVYIVSSVEKITELGLDYVFFDGHGYHNFSQVFNNVKHLEKIDWDIVNASSWHDTESDPDRKRRKQAEFLIKNEVDLNGVLGIATYNDRALRKVKGLLEKYSVDIKIVAMPKWYY